jgi:hypothetical protein
MMQWKLLAFVWRRNLSRMPTTRQLYKHYIQVGREEVDAVLDDNLADLDDDEDVPVVFDE